MTVVVYHVALALDPDSISRRPHADPMVLYLHVGQPWLNLRAAPNYCPSSLRLRFEICGVLSGAAAEHEMVAMRQDIDQIRDFLLAILEECGDARVAYHHQLALRRDDPFIITKLARSHTGAIDDDPLAGFRTKRFD